MFSLTQAAKILNSPQHRLIHLCEKGVVVPDRDAKGRGTSRQFSKRTMLDFAIALEMRRLDLPLSFTGSIVRILRSFEIEMNRMLPGFELPDSLISSSAPSLTILILNGERLYFSVTARGQATRTFGGISIRRPAVRGRGRLHEEFGRLQATELREALGAARTRIDIDLSQIAQALKEHIPSS